MEWQQERDIRFHSLNKFTRNRSLEVTKAEFFEVQFSIILKNSKK